MRELPTEGPLWQDIDTLSHKSSHVKLTYRNKRMSVLVKLSQRATRATSNRVAAYNGIQAPVRSRSRADYCSGGEALIIPSSRDGAWAQKAAPGRKDVGSEVVPWKPAHMSDKFPVERMKTGVWRWVGCGATVSILSGVLEFL